MRPPRPSEDPRPGTVAQTATPLATTMTQLRTLLPLVLLLSACTTDSEVAESKNYLRLGEYSRAFDILDEAREERIAAGQAIDPEFEAAWSNARKEFLLERGRTEIFFEQEDLALVDVSAVLAIDPDHAEAKALRERALEKKAARATQAGDEHLMKLELEAALSSYLEAERYVPDYKLAREGADKVHEAVGKLTAHAQEQFLEAARKLPEFRYVEVRWHATNAVDKDPTRHDAEALKQRAAHELALKAVARSVECRKKDQFGAALMELRAARRIEPTLPGIDADVAQMEREVQATQLIEKSIVQMRMGKFADSRASLDKANGLTMYSRATVNDMRLDCNRLEAEHEFQLCRDLEILGRKREALAAFEALAAKWPAGVKDEKARIEGLRTDITGAETEWAAAEAAEAKGDLPGALDHYEASFRYYGEMKDAKDRIARLRAQLAKSGGS